MTNRYVVVNINTGEIVRAFKADPEQATGQAQDGEEIHLSDEANSKTHYFVNGVLTAYTPAQVELKATPPNTQAVWSNVPVGWVEMRLLFQVKEQAWERIKSRREQAEFGGFTWDGSVFDSDAESQSRIQGASQLATLAMLSSSNFSVDWTLADNTVRTLSIANMLAVGQAMGVHIMTTHGVGRGLRAAIEAATTTAQVEAVTWPV